MKRASWIFLSFTIIVSMGRAQTATDDNLGLRIEYDSLISTAEVSWWGTTGKSYFIQTTDDLLDGFSYLPVIESGSDGVISWGFLSSSAMSFYRIKYVDTPVGGAEAYDFDSDDLTTLEELNLGLDPFAALDLNGNGIPDDWEFVWDYEFAVFPNALTAELTYRGTETQSLYLYNPVTPNSDFTVSLTNNEAGSQVLYTVNDSITGTASYTWTDISSSGTLMADISEDDNTFQEVVLSNFLFPFYGVDYDRLYVASNGLITFGSGTTDQWNDPIPSDSAPNALIALFWDDLNTNDALTGDGGDIYYQQFSDRIIIQYQNVMRDSDSDKTTQSNTFQAVLRSSGIIEVYYQTMGGLLTSATVGIEDQDGLNGEQVAYNTTYLQDTLAIRYEPTPALFVDVKPMSGTTATGSSTELQVTFNSYELSPGEYTTDIEIGHTGTGTSPITISVTLDVINPPADITMTSPDDGDVYWSDESISLRATAIDNDFGIDRVEFFREEIEIYEDLNPSYLYIWNSSVIGTYEMTARAVDQFGEITISDPVTITVLEDADEDRMDDPWELSVWGNLDQEASADFDGDGIPNIFEYNHGTDPKNPSDKIAFAETQTEQFKYFIVDETLAVETDVKKKTVLAAIQAANDFDVIEVLPGEYNEDLGTLYDRLYIFGSSGARQTVITPNGLNDRALYLGSESVISGLTFKGANPTSTSFDGGAVYISISGNQNKPRFIGCRFIENTVLDSAGAIYINSADPLFISCTIAGNWSGDDEGHAIYNTSSSNQITFINTIIWNPAPLNSPQIAGNTSSIVYDHTLIRNDTTGNVLIDGVNQSTQNPGLGYLYALTSASVAINAGSNALYADPDMDGESLTDGQRDIGADEFIDSDTDGLPDWLEALSGGDMLASGNTDSDTLTNLADYNNGGSPFLSDTDGDGLLDDDEVYASGNGDTDGYQTAINSGDTDRDGLSDYWESIHGLNPTVVNLPDADTDNDGVLDVDEFALGSNPNSGNSDTDIMPDLYEFENGLNLTVDDSELDLDNDGLSNVLEYQIGTEPGYFDTDLDLYADGFEYYTDGFDPLVPQAGGTQGDIDGDGLTDFEEMMLGTNPSRIDSDCDGYTDKEEIDVGSYPLDPNDYPLHAPTTTDPECE